MGGAQSLQTTSILDNLGRPIQTQVTSDPDCPSGDRTDTTYDPLGHVATVSNPYCTTSDPTYGVTIYAYDALGHGTRVTYPDNSTILTTYTGRATQVQDEGNSTRRVTCISQTDGLGRLASVCEVSSTSLIGSGGTPVACGQDIVGTGFLTTYQYDALDNLTQVNQAGIGPRTFTYDSLSRLTSASNPESGTITYAYDANGNLITKTDARGITTTFAYDALNRLTSKTYSDSTPSVSFLYDVASTNGVSISNPVGRLVRSLQTSPCAGIINSYDSMGRVTTQWQYGPYVCAGGNSGNAYVLSYGYDLAGDETSSTNGVSVAFNYTWNTATRLTTMTSSLSDSNHPGTLFSSVHYNAAAEFLAGSLGNGITETRTYDSRLRLASIAAGSNYSLTIPSAGGYAPNGNILAANDSVNGNWAYSYDDFNRLSGSNQNNGQSVYSYVYDRFGNRWQQNGTNSMQLTFTGNNPSNPQNNNRMDGYSYDAAGNLLNDGTHQYFYDAENRLVQVDGSSGYCSTGTGTAATACYIYDAEGRRVQKTTPSWTAIQLYDLAGHQITEIGSTGVWSRGEVYAGNRHLATYANGTTYFIHPDWLGTERARSVVGGALCETITSLPFGDGQAISSSCGDPSSMHFTGKERDSESGLDYFGARFNSSSFGRFISPDWADAPNQIPYADLPNPQSLNLYSFTANNPLNRIDFDGHATHLVCESKTETINGVIRKTVTCHEESDPPKKSFAESLRAYRDMWRAYRQTSDPDYKRYLIARMLGFKVFPLPVSPGQDTVGPPTGGLPIPVGALRALGIIDALGSAVPGTRGGRTFANDGGGGGEILPKTDSEGNPITYREWDVNPPGPGGRDAERIVTGSDGSAYFTDDHYKTFKKIR